MKTYDENEVRANLHHVLEQARVQGAVRVRRADGREFVIRPVEGAALFDRLGDERDAWFDTIAPIVAVEDDLRCAGCGYHLRGLPAERQCPECSKPVRETINLVSAITPELRSTLRRAQGETIAESTEYPVDGFLFVIDAVVESCRHNLRSLPRAAVPLSAAELCTIVRDYARQYFNDESEAAELLAEWKIRVSEDIGVITHTLIDAGALTVAGCSEVKEFRGIFTLATLFDR